MKGRAFYDDVYDAFTGFLPPGLRHFASYRTSHNIKVWYGTDREHYEVQSIRRRTGYELEIGFHAEYKEASRNEEVIELLAANEKAWRRALDEPREVRERRLDGAAPRAKRIEDEPLERRQRHLAEPDDRLRRHERQDELADARQAREM